MEKSKISFNVEMCCLLCLLKRQKKLVLALFIWE